MTVYFPHSQTVRQKLEYLAPIIAIEAKTNWSCLSASDVFLPCVMSKDDEYQTITTNDGWKIRFRIEGHKVLYQIIKTPWLPLDPERVYKIYWKPTFAGQSHWSKCKVSSICGKRITLSIQSGGVTLWDAEEILNYLDIQ